MRGWPVRTCDRADTSFPLLTLRRHIDFGRMCSAMCPHA